MFVLMMTDFWRVLLLVVFLLCCCGVCTLWECFLMSNTMILTTEKLVSNAGGFFDVVEPDRQYKSNCFHESLRPSVSGKSQFPFEMFALHIVVDDRRVSHTSFLYLGFKLQGFLDADQFLCATHFSHALVTLLHNLRRTQFKLSPLMAAQRFTELRWPQQLQWNQKSVSEWT